MSSGVTTSGTPAGLTETTAPWSHISFGPAAAWVEAPAFDRNVPAKHGDHVTYLGWERQVSVPLEASFHATAIRLETPAAVQHQSQWRLNLDPRIQHLRLHWLRVVRVGEAFDGLRRDRMRLIQRETQLDHLVIDGQWTLLVVLDDVRVGDIIEAGYTFEGGNPIRPKGCEVFFMVPSTLVVGTYRLQVDFDPGANELAYLTSADAPARSEQRLADGRVRWTWHGQQVVPREPEPNQPSTFLDFIWIQISDLSDWSPLCDRLAELWAREKPPTELGQIPEFARPETVDECAVHRLIRFIQENFRYLSVDMESGGWMPTQPTTVMQRRYGDCKDLAWLATSVLRGWGVSARPILVGTGVRHGVQTMRPMALLFNHAVLEVECAGHARWFDLTLREQGGDFRSQPVPWYGYGLPVEPGASLRPQPGIRSPGLYTIRETIGLDARSGETSIAEVRVRAEGWNAEHLRRTRAGQGAENFAKERLEQARRRFGKAERLGTLQWRDDRANNVCELVEAFEFRDACNPDESGARVVFDVPPNLLIQTCTVPANTGRRGPWDLPHPIEIRHEICFRGRSYRAHSRRRRSWICPEFSASLDESLEEGAWSKIMRFVTKTDEVAVDRISEYRRILDRFLQETTWRLYLPRGETRLLTADAVGALPPPAEAANGYVGPADLADFVDVTTVPPEASDSTVTGGSIIRPWRPSKDSWRVVVPVAVVIALAAAGNFSSPERRAYPSSSSVSPTGGYLRSLADEDETLPPDPEIHGVVHQNLAEIDEQPAPISQPRPKYPSQLRMLGITGRATIDFVLTAEGIPAKITIVDQTDPAFGRSASVAISKWRFRPAMKAGEPVNVALRIPIIFTLDRDMSQNSLFDDGAARPFEPSPSLLRRNNR